MKKVSLILLCLFLCACTKVEEPIIKENNDVEAKLTLKGDDTIYIEYNDYYTDPGYEAFNKNQEDVTDLVTTTGDVLNKPGEYTVTYELNTDDSVITKERKVIRKSIDVSENAPYVPVLMYHYFYDDAAGETGEDGNYLAKSLFEEQLQYLKDNNYYFPTMKELKQYLDGEIKLPPKSIILTMDDGAESNYRIAYPLALKYQIPIVWFVVTSWTDPSLPYQQEIINSGYVSMESHTHDMHQAGCSGMMHGGLFQCIAKEDGINDLKTSKEILKTATTLAYPFGDYNDDTKEMLKIAGYDLAFTTEWGVVKPGMDPYALPRIRISDGNSLATFIASIS